MSSKVTEQDFKELLLAEVGSKVGEFTKIEDTEKMVFPGTVKRSISWQEGDRFFSHKSMTTGRQGQKPSPVFNPSQINEVFPVEVKSTVYLTASEMALQEFYRKDGNLQRAS